MFIVSGSFIYLNIDKEVKGYIKMMCFRLYNGTLSTRNKHLKPDQYLYQARGQCINRDVLLFIIDKVLREKVLHEDIDRLCVSRQDKGPKGFGNKTDVHRKPIAG